MRSALSEASATTARASATAVRVSASATRADRGAHRLGVGTRLLHHPRSLGGGLGPHLGRVEVGGDPCFLADLRGGGGRGGERDLRLELRALERGGGLATHPLGGLPGLFGRAGDLTPARVVRSLAHSVSPGVMRTGYVPRGRESRIHAYAFANIATGFPRGRTL